MSFFSKFSIYSRCSICGREISPFEKRLYFNVPEAPKNNRLWMCTECSKIKGKAIFPPDGSLKIKKPDGTIIDTATSSVNEVDVKSINKSIITLLITTLILSFVAWIIGVTFFGWNDNANKSSGANYKTCAMCGDRVPEDDMRGNWCKDCQNDAFGKDGWYYDIKD